MTRKRKLRRRDERCNLDFSGRVEIPNLGEPSPRDLPHALNNWKTRPGSAPEERILTFLIGSSLNFFKKILISKTLYSDH